MERLENSLTKYPFISLLFFSLPAIWSLFITGYFGVSDDLHVGWLYEMDQAVRAGQFPPRFVPDLSYGFGYPLFNFVFPLPFYIGELFHLVGGLSFVDSLKSVLILGLLGSVFTMYLLLKELMGKGLALAGSVLYLYTPYRAVEVYVRGAVGEALAFLFLPLIVLSVLKLSNLKKLTLFNRWIGIGALSVGALVLTHNITTYMFLPFVAVLAFILIGRSLAKLFGIFVSLVLGLLVSLYFWLPALLDTKLVKYDTVFNFIDHFPTLKQLITPFWGYGASVAGPYDGMSFFLGMINIFLMVAGLILGAFYWRKISKTNKIILIWSYLTLLTTIFMMNYRSSFLWSNLPLVPYFQFPWRFLVLTTFVTPIFLIVLNNFRGRSYLSLLIIFLAVGLNFTFFKPEKFLGRMDDYYINRYIPSPVASEEYKKTSEEYLRLPVSTQVRPDKNYPLIYPTGKGMVHDIKMINPFKTEFLTEGELTVNYAKYNFPGWIALIDGKSINLNSGSPFGQINFSVPSGQHRVEVRFEEISYKQGLDVLSLISFLIALGLILKKRVRVV